MTEVRGVIYTNFNPTKCRKKCNFFHFLNTWKNSTFSGFFLKEFRIKGLFLHLISCLYIRIKSLIHGYKNETPLTLTENYNLGI
ncbi:hypothetical protein C6497_12275 [Candidatus Poribacteria bacterium]|nr:MAG: hypothetical protein C6497_12275 [Candidatus Poribacteria bacterium]